MATNDTVFSTTTPPAKPKPFARQLTQLTALRDRLNRFVARPWTVAIIALSAYFVIASVVFMGLVRRNNAIYNDVLLPCLRLTPGKNCPSLASSAVLHFELASFALAFVLGCTAMVVIAILAFGQERFRTIFDSQPITWIGVSLTAITGALMLLLWSLLSVIGYAIP